MTYTYNGTVYYSETAVRRAIWATERKAFGAVDSTEAWAALGVEYAETEESEPTLDVLKAKKLIELTRSYDEAVAGSFTTSHGYVMQFAPDDCLKMEGAIKLLQAQIDALDEGEEEPTGYITQANDETVYGISVETMTEVEMEMLARYATCHLLKQQYRAAITAAESAEGLDAIEFDWEG